MSRAASWGYGFQMKSAPATYEVFYDWLCRFDRFADLSKRAIGSFFGRVRIPTVTYIPALDVHPLWAYAGIDQTYVMYDTAHVHAARRASRPGCGSGRRRCWSKAAGSHPSA